MLRRWVTISKRYGPEDLSPSRNAPPLSPYVVVPINAESIDILLSKSAPRLRTFENRSAYCFLDHLDRNCGFPSLQRRATDVPVRSRLILRRTPPIETAVTRRHFHGVHSQCQQQETPSLGLNLEDDGLTQAGPQSKTKRPRQKRRKPQTLGRVQAHRPVIANHRHRKLEFWRHSARHLLIYQARSQIGAGKYEAALSHIVHALKCGAHVKTRKLRKVCGLLLRDALKEGNMYRYSADIMAKLLELGFSPSITEYNILIQHAADAKDPATAWEIYNLIRANNIVPDEATYTILMKLCRMTDDKSAYRQLHYHLRPQHAQSLGQILTTEVLCCRHYLEDKWNFDHMLLAYERLCDLQPLKDLGMIDQDHSSRFSGTHPLPRPVPSAETLNVMLISFFKSNRSFNLAMETYHNFQKILQREGPVSRRLIRNETTYNIFLKAISRNPYAFGILPDKWFEERHSVHWPNMIKAMIAPPRTPLRERHTGKTPPLKPTADTWNIILAAYAREGFVAETETIIKWMQKEGLEVGAVTWNKLLNGFARNQAVDHVAQIFQDMKARGFKIDDVSARALLRVNDKERLLNKIRELQQGDDTEPLLTLS